MRRALLVASILLFAAVVGFVALARSAWLEARVRAAILGAASRRLAADLRVDSVRVRVLPLSLELSGVAVRSRSSPDLPPVLEARRIRVSVDPVLLVVGRVDIDRVLVVDPSVTLVVDGNEVVNLPRPAAAVSGTPGRRGLTVVVRTVDVSGGRVRIEFPRKGPLAIDVALERLTLRPDLPARAADFEVVVNEASLTRKRFRQPIDGARAEGRITAAGLTIRRFHGEAGGLVATARGEIAPFPQPELRLAGTVRGPLAGVARLYVEPYTREPFPLSGLADVTFRSSGPAARAEFEASLAASDVRLASVRADRVSLETRVTYDRTIVRAARIEAGGASLAVTGEVAYDPPVPFGARVRAAGIPVGVLARMVGAPAPPEPLAGAVLTGEVEIDGAALAHGGGRGRAPAPDASRPARDAVTSRDGGWRVGGRAALRVVPPPAAAGEPAAALALRTLLPAVVVGRFAVDREAVRLDGATVQTEAGGTGAGLAAAAGERSPSLDLALAGTVGTRTPHTLALEGRVSVGDLAALEPLLRGLLGGRSLAGALTSSGAAVGPAAAPTFTGTVETTGLAVGRYRVGRLAGPLAASRDGIETERLAWQPGATRAVLKGRVDLRPDGGAPAPVLALDVTADPFVVGDALAAAGVDLPIEGRGRMTARLSGPLTALEGDVSVRLAKGRLYGQPLDRVEAAVALGEAGAVRVSRLTAALGPGRLTAHGARGPGGELSGSASLERLPAEALRVLAGRDLPLAGALSASATLGGRWDAPRLTGRIGVAQAAYGGVPLGDSGVDVALDWPDLALRGTLVQREVGVVANLRLTGARPFVVALDLDNPNLAPYLARAVEGRTVRASARGLARAAGSLNDLEGARAELRLAALRLDIGDFYLQNVGEVAAVYDRRRLSIVSATLQGPTSQAVFGGQVDLGSRTLDLRVNGGLDLSFARLFTDRLTRSRGTARVVAQAVGSFDSPRLFGAAQVEGGAFVVRSALPQVAVEELTGLVVFDATRIVADNLTMRVGGGQATVSGTVELAAFTPSRLNLSAAFEDVRLAIPSWLPTTSRGDLRLSGPPGDLFVSGRVEVVQATYNRRIDVNLEALYRAIRAALEPRRASRPAAAATGPRVDIRITADDDIRIETGLFDAELRADLQLVGRLPEPNLLGSAEVLSGTITFRGTTFTITSGRADFIDPFRINPSFDLTAEAEVREFEITMRLSGTVERYRLEFSSPSHPSLTELDILTLLTVGVTTAEVRGAPGAGERVPGAQVTAAEALAILSGGGLRPLEREVRRLVGVDTFQIDPSVSRATGDAGAKLTVGKQIGQDLTVLYSVGLSGEQTFQIEYRLSTNLALIAQRDELRSVSGGVKFRFQFR